MMANRKPKSNEPPGKSWFVRTRPSAKIPLICGPKLPRPFQKRAIDVEDPRFAVFYKPRLYLFGRRGLAFCSLMSIMS